MPRALNWSSDHDEKLSILLNKKKMTLRSAAKLLGVSRSFVHRKSQKIQKQVNFRTCSSAREEAGLEPLAVGHPISWKAIATRQQTRTHTNMNTMNTYYHADAA